MRPRLKIWIDLENSPHVLFFEPVIDERAGAATMSSSPAAAS
jgi:predicted glycosyltransferase